jgi:hypothetical protein
MSIVLNDDEDQYLQAALTSTRPVTIMAWAKPDNVSNPGVIAEVGRVMPYPSDVLYVQLGGSHIADIYDYLGNAQALTSFPNEWTPLQWNHVLISSASHVDRSLWIDGLKTTNSLDSGSHTFAMTRLIVGRSKFNPSIPMGFDGKIAHVAIWDIVLSDGDIALLAARARPDEIQSDHLLGYWQLINSPVAFIGDPMTAYGSPAWDAGDDPLLQWSASMCGFGVFEPVMDCLTLAPAWQLWTWPVAETLSFETEVLQPHDRIGEQRIAKRRKIPGQAFSTRLMVRGEAETAVLESALHRWLKRPWPVPLWPEAARLTASLPAGSGSVAVETRYADYRAGGYALLWNRTGHEILWIESVAADSITLSRITEQPWTTSDWIMPLRQGRIVSIAGHERFHGGALTAVEIRVTDAAAVTGFVADQTYDDLTVLTTPSKWPGGSGEVRHDPDVAVLQSVSGPFEVVSNSDYNEVIQAHTQVCTTPAEVWSLRQFLHANAGRQKAFLVPTFRKDLIVSRQVGAADTQVYIHAGPFAANMNGNTLRTYVAFRPSGSLIVRKISAIETISATEERLTLDAAPGQVFGAGSDLCWVDKCRLAEDAVRFEWQSRRLMTCTVQLVRVT